MRLERRRLGLVARGQQRRDRDEQCEADELSDVAHRGPLCRWPPERAQQPGSYAPQGAKTAGGADRGSDDRHQRRKRPVVRRVLAHAERRPDEAECLQDRA